MSIFIKVANQRMCLYSPLKELVSGSQEFVRFEFVFNKDWDNLTTFAQFTQNGIAYNQYLDENNGVYLPPEIKEGTCTLMLYGSRDKVIATTNYLTLKISKDILIKDAQSTEITESLYNQLVTKVDTFMSEAIVHIDESIEKEMLHYVENELATFDFIKIVSVLPEIGLVNRFYLIPKSNAQNNDLFDEYIWVNKGTEIEPNWSWEWMGTKQVEVDLNDYVKNTDYATTNKAGLVYPTGYGGVTVTSTGGLNLKGLTQQQIIDRNNQIALKPTDLDYAVKVGLTTNTEDWTEDEKTSARELVGAVGETDFPTSNKAGVVKILASQGIKINDSGVLSLQAANNALIDEKKNVTYPIMSNKIDYAVKVGLTTNTETLTEEEKAAACEWLGIDTLVGDIETALDSIIAIQESLIGGDA